MDTHAISKLVMMATILLALASVALLAAPAHARIADASRASPGFGVTPH